MQSTEQLEHEEHMNKIRNQFVITCFLASMMLILSIGAIVLMAMGKNEGAGMLLDMIGYSAVGVGGYSLGQVGKLRAPGSTTTIPSLLLMALLLGVLGFLECACSSQASTWQIGLERAELSAEHTESGTIAAIDVRAILGPVGILGVVNLDLTDDRQLLEVCTTGDVAAGALTYKVCVSCDLVSSACWVCYGIGDTAECRPFGGNEGTVVESGSTIPSRIAEIADP